MNGIAHHAPHADVSLLRHPHPDTIALAEEVERPGIPAPSPCGHKAVFARVIPSPVLALTEIDVILAVPRFAIGGSGGR